MSGYVLSTGKRSYDSQEILEDKCQDCRRCPHALTRKQVVFSKGNPLSTLAFVGEAPGADEDEQGVPFVGQAGRLRDKQIQAMRDYAADLGIAFPASPYVCNVLKCRPPGNKLLSNGSDVAACSDWLWQQLRLLPNLRVIVALGKTAGLKLLETDAPIKRETMADIRGHVFRPALLCRRLCDDESKAPQVVATYHPAYLLRKPLDTALHAEAWSDLKRAVEALR